MLFQFLYRSKNISPDFYIFYETTERFLSDKNLYFSESGGIGYAPTLVYFLFSPLTLFEPQTASRLFMAMNYFLILLVVFILYRFLSIEQMLIVLTVLNASYSMRSIINNGQIGALVLTLQLIFLILLDKQSIKLLFLKSAILFALIELKPYLILPYFIYLIVLRKKEAYLAIGYALIFELIYFSINPTSTIYYYVKLIIERSQNTKNEIDQSSLLSLVNGNITLFILYLMLIFIFTLKNFPKFERERAIVLFLLSPLISTYFHRQDSVFAILIFALLLTKINKYFTAILIFLLLHTGTFSIYFLIQLFLMLLVLTLLIPLTKKIGMFVALILTTYSYVIYSLNNSSGYEGAYGLWTPLVFFFQFLVFVFYANSNKNMKLFDKNAKQKPDKLS
jgi:hypothetical protein